MVYASLFGNSLFLAFGKCLHGFRKTFTPAKGSIQKKRIWKNLGKVKKDQKVFNF